MFLICGDLSGDWQFGIEADAAFVAGVVDGGDGGGCSGVGDVLCLNIAASSGVARAGTGSAAFSWASRRCTWTGLSIMPLSATAFARRGASSTAAGPRSR
jgi:hypothetical protein